MFNRTLLCLMMVFRFWSKLKQWTLAGQSLILNMCMKCWGRCVCIAMIIAQSLCKVSHFSDLHVIMWTADDSCNRVYRYHRIFAVKKVTSVWLLLRLCLLCLSYLLLKRWLKIFMKVSSMKVCVNLGILRINTNWQKPRFPYVAIVKYLGTIITNKSKLYQ